MIHLFRNMCLIMGLALGNYFNDELNLILKVFILYLMISKAPSCGPLTNCGIRLLRNTLIVIHQLT